MIKAEKIDINDWVKFGEGGYAISYLNRKDPGIVLKLNASHLSREESVSEYVRSVAAHDSGISCPETYAFVTDGKRYGVITERLPEKKSFSRMLADNPEMMDVLAREMAEAARELHETPCDTSLFDDVSERWLSEINACQYIPDDIRDELNSYAAELSHSGTFLHSDIQPGNLVRSAGKDYWIDLGDSGYGDPDLDFASMYMIAYLTPAPVVKWLLHISRRNFRRFVDRYGQYYYGDRYQTPELRRKLAHVTLFKMGHSMARRSGILVRVYGSLYRGRTLPFRIKMFFLDILVRKVSNR